MFARFCGFGPGHKSTRLVTKVFREDIEEAFGLDHGSRDVRFEEILPDDDDSEHALPLADEKELQDESDGDSDSEENGEDPWDHGDDLDYFALEEELGYAPL